MELGECQWMMDLGKCAPGLGDGGNLNLKIETARQR